MPKPEIGCLSIDDATLFVTMLTWYLCRGGYRKITRVEIGEALRTFKLLNVELPLSDDALIDKCINLRGIGEHWQQNGVRVLYVSDNTITPMKACGDFSRIREKIVQILTTNKW